MIEISESVADSTVRVGTGAVSSGRRMSQVVRDYLSLTKPGVMSLLLATELLTMITAAGGWPGWGLVVAALAGGACSSGGAAALNCWFDRDIDAVMGRTKQRPIPSGRISAWRGFWFGSGLSVAGFLIFWLAVNPLAALLSAGGGAFYLFVYTFWLKRSTKENIVIGGAAGAMPPLVGWAAVTHGLGLVPVVLFAVIFLWTPPHFWALSLIVRRDYEAVSVPMRPVVDGVTKTRWAIVAYSVPLVACSATLGFWLGPWEVALALVLGAPFLALGIRNLWGGGLMKRARQLFQFSILYLFLFFLGTAVVASLAR